MNTHSFTWNETTLPIFSGWREIIYGNGRFVAFGTNSSPGSQVIAYSSDGINWTPTTIQGVDEPLGSAVYGGGKFVAVGDRANGKYSYDGIAWEAMSIPANGVFYSVAYGDGKFVAVGYDKNGTQNSYFDVAFSYDGIVWIQANVPSVIGYGIATAYGEGKFVSILGNSNIAMYSNDGISWTQTTIVNAYWRSAAYGNGVFVAVGHSKAAYSNDGISWTETILPDLEFSEVWTHITYGDGLFIVHSFYYGTYAYSNDGINWTKSSLPSRLGYRSSAYGQGRIVSVAYASTIAAYSSPLPSPSITPGQTASGTVGQAFSFTPASTGTITSWAASNLPGGLSINASTGEITGTPTNAGSSSPAITATNSAGSDTETLAFTIAAAIQPPSIPSGQNASGTVGQAFSFTPSATGAVSSWSATGLPAGLSISTSTGAITGTPTTAGSFSPSITATNSAGSDTESVAFTITAAAIQPPSISPGQSASGTVGTAFSFTPSAAGTISSWSATGLPAGLSINVTSGLISGTPTTAGSFSPSITATNSAGSDTESVAFTITLIDTPEPGFGPYSFGQVLKELSTTTSLAITARRASWGGTRCLVSRGLTAVNTTSGANSPRQSMKAGLWMLASSANINDAEGGTAWFLRANDLTASDIAAGDWQFSEAPQLDGLTGCLLTTGVSTAQTLDGFLRKTIINAEIPL